MSRNLKYSYYNKAGPPDLYTATLIGVKDTLLKIVLPFAALSKPINLFGIFGV